MGGKYIGSKFTISFFISIVAIQFLPFKFDGGTVLIGIINSSCLLSKMRFSKLDNVMFVGKIEYSLLSMRLFSFSLDIFLIILP